MEEIELTYLVKQLPRGTLRSPSKDILDIYIPTVAEHPTLRIRKAGDTYEVTKKEPVKEGDASHQIESTVSLAPEEFLELSSLKGKRIWKTRYYYEENDISYEIDVFGGSLAGLVLADVEFSSPQKKTKFPMPPWCLADVTQEKFIAGGMLCGKSYADIEEDLKKLGYQKILPPLI